RKGTKRLSRGHRARGSPTGKFRTGKLRNCLLRTDFFLCDVPVSNLPVSPSIPSRRSENRVKDEGFQRNNKSGSRAIVAPLTAQKQRQRNLQHARPDSVSLSQSP